MATQQALGSRYLLEERINSGGMGEIWRGRDLTGDEPVAVKLLHERFASDPTEVTRFVRERTVLTGLRHPNLVPVRDMIMEGDRLALVMDYVEGPDMFRYLRAHGRLAPALAATLIAQVCEALEAVHAAGIVHRDLKPGNIILDESLPIPTARLTDFGIAWAEDALPLTVEGVIVGTPPYCAPEVVSGERGGPPVDVYAAGTSLYELLVGKPPFAGGPASVVFWRHVDAEPLRPPGIPDSLWAVIAACLAKDPAQRPEAGETARLLRECLPALGDAPAAPELPADAARFTLAPPAQDEDWLGGEEPEDRPDAEGPPDAADLEPYDVLAPVTAVDARALSSADTGPRPANANTGPRPAKPNAGPRPANAGPGRRRRWTVPTMRLVPPLVGLVAMGGIATAASLVSFSGHGTPPRHDAAEQTPQKVRISLGATPAFSVPAGWPTQDPSRRPSHARPTRHPRSTPHVAPQPSVPPPDVTPAGSTAPGGASLSHGPAHAPAPSPTHAPTTAAPVTRTLYSFDDGTTDGWQAGANVTSISAVGGFAEAPGRPYEGKYALDGVSMDGADIPVARTMSVRPASPLNLSAAKDFDFAVDGYSYAPYATGYTVTVTLSGESQALSGSLSVQANAWTYVVLPISSWAQRDRVTGISISYTAIGSNTPWYPSFQIDDVGYTT